MHFLCFIRKTVTTFIPVPLWLWGWRKRTLSSCRSCPPWPDFSEQQSSSWAAARKINTAAQRKHRLCCRMQNWIWAKRKQVPFFFTTKRRNTLSQAEPKEEDQRCSQALKHQVENRDWENQPLTWKKIHTDLFVYTHFPRKVCTVEFGVILSSLYWSFWNFPFLPKEGRRDAFEDERRRTLLSYRDKGRQLGRTLHWLGGWRMTISNTWFKKKKKVQHCCRCGGLTENMQGQRLLRRLH